MDAITSTRRLSSVFALKQDRTIFLDNGIFKLHYKYAFAFLMASTFLLTGSLWFGKPISCIVSETRHKVTIEGYCLVHGVKTYHPTITNPKYRPEELYPGVGPYTTYDSEYVVERHHLYKWTALIMFFMAVCNYTPHFLWKIAEGGRLHMLVQHMDSRYIVSSQESSIRAKKAAKWFFKKNTQSNRYLIAFIICELLNVINCALQLFIISSLFGHEMWSEQIEVVRDVFTSKRNSLLNRKFPKSVKCDMPSFGPSGTVEIVDALCHLHQNYYTEVVLIISWFWYLFAGSMSFVYIVVCRLRFFSRKQRINLLFNLCPIAKKKDIELITSALGIADMFILHHLCSIIEAYHIEPLIDELASRIRSDPSLITQPVRESKNENTIGID